MSLDVRLYRERFTTYDKVTFEEENEELYSANITHNLGKMATESGIYNVLWRPEENNITIAEDLIKPLEKGLQILKEKPDYFKQFDAENGWGMYIHFVPFVEEYLNACKKYPDALVKASR